MVQFFHSEIFSLIHFRTAGSAYKLSTGISKKPCRKELGQFCFVFLLFHLLMIDTYK